LTGHNSGHKENSQSSKIVKAGLQMAESTDLNGGPSRI
jgi:hypothetical protein